MDACACMGIRDGDTMCYCQLKAAGLSTKHYEWTAEDEAKLDAALSAYFN